MAQQGGVISYPIPLFQNLTIDSDFYQPSRFIISAITRGQTTTITTSADQNYVVGQLVRLLIPGTYGTIQLNGRQGYVISVPSTTQVVVDIDSSFMDAFISSSATTKAQILAIGDGNSGVTNSSGRINQGTYILGSFINISPQ